MVSLLMTILPTLIVLNVLIFIHELGHFLFAKRAGIEVEKFCLGFGPELFHVTARGTRYAVALVPFGGYVKMAGETIEERKETDLKPTDFLSKSILNRMAVIVSGPLMNYVLAIVLLVIVFMAGKPVISTQIGKLIEDYPAAEAGLLVNDIIVSVDGVAVSNWNEVREHIATSAQTTLSVRVKRGSEELQFSIIPEVSQEGEGEAQKTVKKIGIYPSDEPYYIRYSFPNAVKESFLMTYTITAMTYNALYKLVTGKLEMNTLSGPLGIMVITSKTAEHGIRNVMQLTAFLSISLAIFNLLPIPALDGGHLFFLLIEAIMRKPVSFKVQERFSQIGFALLMVLMVFVLWNDTVNFEILEKIKRFIPGQQ